MKKIVALAVIGLLIAMTLPQDAFKGAPPKQLIAPIGNLYIVVDPISIGIGWAAGKLLNYMYDHWNDPQYVNGMFNDFGSGCPNCNG